MKKEFLTILLLLFSLYTNAKTGWQRTITNYTRYEYNASNQNWMNSQQSNGWIYFANNKGLLEFDGTRWKTYPINNAKLRALYIDENQKIYVGGLSQFGYFEPDDRGILTYHCLSNNLEKSEIGNIWNIHKVGESVYYQSDKSVFYYNQGKIRKIECPRGAVCSSLINNTFYIVSNNSIESLLGNKFVKVCTTSDIITSRILKMLSFGDEILLVTSRDGLFIFDGKNIKPFNSSINDAIKNNHLFCAAISNKFLAIGTVQNGVFLYSLKDKSVEHISIENGLQNKSILSLLFDNDDNLWLGLDNGIDCIHLDSSYYFLNSSKTLLGAGYSSRVYNSRLYFGTNQGIYSSLLNLTPNEDINLKAIDGSEGEIWSLNEIEGDLFGCGRNALMVINSKEVYTVPNIRGVWSIHSLSKNIAIAGTYFGFYIIKKVNNRWIVDSRVKNGNSYSSKSLYVEKTPEGIYLWSANKENGLFRLKLSNDYKEITASVNLNNEKLPKGYNIHIDQIDGDVVICSRFGLYKYNRITDELVRDFKLEKKLGSGNSYTFINEDEYNNIWFVEKNMLKIYSPSSDSSKERIEEEYRLRNSLIEDFESVTIIDSHSAVVGTEDGFSLIKYKESKKPAKLSFQIRDIYIPEKDSILYQRSYNREDCNIKLSYNNNSIGLRYTVTNYKKLSPSLFSYSLIGSDDESWSEYSTNNFKEYLNLSEGDYIFRVKTILGDGQSIMEDSVAFTISPPWFRSWIAYTLYILIIMVLIYYIYSYFSKKFKHQKQEYIQIADQKDQRINLLEQEKLERELIYKSDELIRSSLNIVRKNEILEKIKKEAVGLNNSITDSSIMEIKRKVFRLIAQIDDNIAHDEDLKKFQESFDSVNHDFFRLLSERYPELTKRDKLLCIYIKMDLQSKEIAPLLNITVRGVEISRYRLRKKLMLEDRENLLEFLQKIS